MVEKGKIYGISLGPGDPELITLKGYKILQSVNRIYYPGSLFAKENKKSYSLTILEALDLDLSKSEGFFLEMNLDRIQAQKIYTDTANKIGLDVQKGLSVAVVCEGDLSTYSSFSYLLESFIQKGLNVELVPGITSFALAASENQLPLVLLNETMKVIPRVASEKDLLTALTENTTVVLMKIKSVMRQIFSVLQQDGISFVYAEHLGTSQQFICTKLDELKKRKPPYFSLLIIKKTMP